MLGCTGEQLGVVDRRRRPVSETRQEWLCRRGWESLANWESLRSSVTRNGLGPGYKVFARPDDIFAGRRYPIGRKVETAVETAHRSPGPGPDKDARNLPCGQTDTGALGKSHGLLAELLPEVGAVKFIQEDVGENDKVK